MTPEEELETARQRERMIAEGVLNPDGSPRHTCPWCCEGFDYVVEGASLWFQSVKDHMDSLPWWWRWVHPVRWAGMGGRREALADVLDEVGK